MDLWCTSPNLISKNLRLVSSRLKAYTGQKLQKAGQLVQNMFPPLPWEQEQEQDACATSPALID